MIVILSNKESSLICYNGCSEVTISSRIDKKAHNQFKIIKTKFKSRCKCKTVASIEKYTKIWSLNKSIAKQFSSSFVPSSCSISKFKNVLFQNQKYFKHNKNHVNYHDRVYYFKSNFRTDWINKYKLTIHRSCNFGETVRCSYNLRNVFKSKYLKSCIHSNKLKKRAAYLFEKHTFSLENISLNFRFNDTTNNNDSNQKDEFFEQKNLKSIDDLNTFRKLHHDLINKLLNSSHLKYSNSSLSSLLPSSSNSSTSLPESSIVDLKDQLSNLLSKNDLNRKLNLDHLDNYSVISESSFEDRFHNQNSFHSNHENHLSKRLKNYTEKLKFLRPNNKLNIASKQNASCSSNPTKLNQVSLKKNQLKQIIFNTDMITFNSAKSSNSTSTSTNGNLLKNDIYFSEHIHVKQDSSRAKMAFLNTQDLERSITQTVSSSKSLNKISNKIDLFSANDSSIDYLEYVSNKLRCFSEPPSQAIDADDILNNRCKGNDLKKSPTLKLLFKNLLKNLEKQKTSLIPFNDDLDSFSNKLEDFLNTYKCNQLAFKRSFSLNKLKLEKKYIKKSPSFEKFLKNVVNGKRKSNSLCTFNANSAKGIELIEFDLISARKESSSLSSVSIRDNSSSESDNINEMMMLIMNNKTNSNWPVLKIDDSLRESTIDLEKTIELNQRVAIAFESDVNRLSLEPRTNSNSISNKNNRENYIPESVRNALEQAGINIDEIINMTNQLQMSFNNNDIIDSVDSKTTSEKFDSNNELKEQVITTKTIVSNDLQSNNNLENQLEALIDNMKSFEVNKITNYNNSNQSFNEQIQVDEKEKKLKSSNHLVSSTSSLKAVEIKQNLSAKIVEKVENNTSTSNCAKTNDLDENENKIAKNNRKKSISNIRYATVSNFILPTALPISKTEILTIEKLREDSFNENKITFSPSWNSEINSSFSNNLSSESSNGSSMNKILPPKLVSQFKPIVNIHKRLSTTPVANITQLISSASTDSFLNFAAYCNQSVKQDLDSKCKNSSDSAQTKSQLSVAPLDALNQINENQISTLDLSKSLPSRNKKKVSVTRSFSYNIGRLTGSKQTDSTTQALNQSKTSLANTNSFNKSVDSGKNKVSLVSINDVTEMAKSNAHANNTIKAKTPTPTTPLNISEKTFSIYSSKSSEKLNANCVAGQLNNAVAANKIVHMDNYNQNKKTLIALLNSDQNKLPSTMSTTSLTGLVDNDFDLFKNTEDIHHVN